MVTFLMVFLIQNTQNREAEAVQVKLDELLRIAAGAHNALLDLEELEEGELDQIRAGYGRLAERARADLRRGQCDTGVPEIGTAAVQSVGPRRSVSISAESAAGSCFRLG
jgi:low affinity Fe/Cu permease